MKKLYTLSLLVLCAFTSFAQTFYSENFGVPSSNTAVATYTGYQNTTPIVYSGTGATVRNNTPSSTYAGASGGGNVFFNTGHTFIIEGINTSAYSAADLRLTFGFKQDQGPALPGNNLLLEKSTDGTQWDAVSYTRTGTAWELITIGGGVIPSTANLRLRWTNTGTTNSQYRVDDVKVSAVSASCTLNLAATETKVCNASTLSFNDTYNATIGFTGGGNATYAIVVSTGTGTIAGNNPSTSATGDIQITNIPEGTNVTITITGGTCNITREITGISCKPINTLPYVDSFEYGVGNSLGAMQKWETVNSGDAITAIPGSLNYTGITSAGNSVAFSGSGAEAYTPFTSTSTGTVYASFLMSVTDLAGVTTDDTQTYFAGLLKANDPTNYNIKLFTKKVGAQYQIGFDNIGGSSTTNYTTSAYNVGDVVLLIVGFDYTDSTYKLWVNPATATFNPASAPTLTKVVTTAPIDFGGFILRQDDTNNTPAITIDELRIGTSVSDILTTKSFNEISGLKLFPNPLSGNVLNVTSDSSADKSVAIFDVLGKNVMNAKVTNETVNVSGLNGGIYIVKITEEGKTATRKLVIK